MARAAILRRQLIRLLLVLLLPVALLYLAFVGRVRAQSAPRVARQLVRNAARLTGVRFETRGRLDSRPGVPKVLVANHSSPIDIPALLVAHPTVCFVAGADLFKIPLLASAMRALGTVPVDRRSRNGVHLRVSTSQRGDRTVLAVFPEGAIAPAGQRLEFRRGAFALAIEEQADVIPVAIHHSARLLPPKGRLGVRPGLAVIEYLPAIRSEGMTLKDRHLLCQQAEHAILAALDPSDGGNTNLRLEPLFEGSTE